MIDARHDAALAFLRQDYPAPVAVQGLVYASVAHALLAAQTVDSDARTQIAQARSLEDARWVAASAPVRDDWTAIEERSVWYLVRLKFSTHPDLEERLLSLPPEPIIAALDPVWGLDDQDEGDNRLGDMLGRIRGRSLIAYAERVLGPATTSPATRDHDNLSLFNTCT